MWNISWGLENSVGIDFPPLPRLNDRTKIAGQLRGCRSIGSGVSVVHSMRATLAAQCTCLEAEPTSGSRAMQLDSSPTADDQVFESHLRWSSTVSAAPEPSSTVDLPGLFFT